jgi:hypothetical protein
MRGSPQERESGLWLRAGLLLLVAPGLLTILVYVTAPWVAPSLSENARALAAVGIGFGTAYLFSGIYGFGTLRLAGDTARSTRVALQSHFLSSISLGLAALLMFTSRSGSALRGVGWILLVVGIGIRVATHLMWIVRRREQRSAAPQTG